MTTLDEIRHRWKELQKTTFEGVALRERTTAHALDARQLAASLGIGREFDEHFNRFCAALTNAPTDIAYLLQRVRELEAECGDLRSKLADARWQP